MDGYGYRFSAVVSLVGVSSWVVKVGVVCRGVFYGGVPSIYDTFILYL